MIVAPSQWTALDADGRLLWLKYSFRPGTANSLAVRQRDGGWMVISPPSGVPIATMEALAQTGAVKALVAPNGFHILGQRAWRTHFPNAISYAPLAAGPGLSRKMPEIVFKTEHDLAGVLNPGDALVLPDGMKLPDLLLRFAAQTGPVWWLGDMFSNSSVSDQIWPLRLLSRFAGSGLGYRCNARPELVYVSDRKAWLMSIRAALHAAPPAIVMPAHGDPVTTDAAQRTLQAIAAVDRDQGNSFS